MATSFLSSLLSGGQMGLGFGDQTTNTNSNTNSTQNQNGTQSTQRTLTPFQSALQSPLFSYITQLMSNPAAATAPFQQQARSNVNSNYSGLADSLRQQFLGTGGGQSGKYGLALQQGNLNRVSDLSNVDNTFAQTNASLPLQASTIASNLLGMNFGQTTDTSSAATGTSNTSGSSSTNGFNFKI